MHLKILIIMGSTRPNRKSEKIARWVYEEIQKRPEFIGELIDLRDWPLPFYNERESVSDLDGNYSVEIAKQWAAKVASADGYIIVTPEYNHGYPAVLKNALDYAYDEWNHKPVAFVSYGGSAGGARSVEQLRLVAIELDMAPLRAGVYITQVSRAFDESGEKFKDEGNWNKRLASLFSDLAWWAALLKLGRGHKQS